MYRAKVSEWADNNPVRPSGKIWFYLLRFYLQNEGPFAHFSYLSLNIEEMFLTAALLFPSGNAVIPHPTVTSSNTVMFLMFSCPGSVV